MIAHPEGLSIVRKRQARWRDKILCGKPGFRQVAPFKMKFLLAVRVELAVQKLQAFQAI